MDPLESIKTIIWRGYVVADTKEGLMNDNSTENAAMSVPNRNPKELLLGDMRGDSSSF